MVNLAFTARILGTLYRQRHPASGTEFIAGVLLEGREAVPELVILGLSRFLRRSTKGKNHRPLPPQELETLVGYLKRVKHVGVKRATDLVARFGPPAVFDVIDRDARAAFAAVGLRGQRAEDAAASWQTIRVTRRLHLLLAPHGLAYLAPRIHEHYGDDAHEILDRDPYALTSVFGVGFLIADRIARASEGGIEPGRRERAAIVHVLSEAERNGSTCLPEDALSMGGRRITG